VLAFPSIKAAEQTRGLAANLENNARESHWV